MQKNRVWRQFEALPPSAQRQVADFISFLSARLRRRPESSISSLADEPFIGVWKDRPELADSEAWVRRVREEEWASGRE